MVYQKPQPDSVSRGAILIFDLDLDDAVLNSVIETDLNAPWNKSWIDSGIPVYCLLVGSSVKKRFLLHSNGEPGWSSKYKAKYLRTLVLKSSMRIEDTFERVGVLEVKKESGKFSWCNNREGVRSDLEYSSSV